MNFDYGKYSDLICAGNFDKARMYKNSFIPNKLYKYIGLQDARLNNWEEENIRRFNALENNETWLSTYENLNDPFEYKALFIDKRCLKKYGWDTEIFDIIFDFIRKYTLVSCLSKNFNNNMPMWAHYASNHYGYCIEYEIERADLIYKVSYESKRFPTASIVTNLVCDISKLREGRTDEKLLSGIRRYLTVLHLSNTVKHNTWEYEEEYRLLYSIENKEEVKGRLIKNDLLGIKPIGIYIGMSCSKENQIRLVEISEKINCPIYKMYFANNSKEYTLKKRIIS